MSQQVAMFSKTGSADFPTFLKCMITGPPKSGKGLAHGQRVLTPSGWASIETLRVGDEISHPYHGTTVVTGVFPQGERPLYEVTTDDGGRVVCDDQHLWTVRPHGLSERTVRVTELAEAIASNSRYGYLPTLDALGMPTTTGDDLPLDPYILGLLLGDGGLTGTPKFHKPDPELHVELADALSAVDTRVGEWDDSANALRLTGGKLRGILDRLGLRVVSHEKHIPTTYLDQVNPASRLALLSGLLDTDGGMNGRSTCFYTSSAQLAADVQQLVWGLGGSAVIRDKVPTYVHKGEALEGRLAYNISIRLPEWCGNPFTLARKREAWFATGTAKRPPTRRVVSVSEAGIGESTCIKVAAEDGLFITEDYVVTHNTTMLGTVPNILILDTEPHANNLQSIAHLDVPFKAITSTDDLRQAHFILSQETFRKQAAQALGMDDIQAVAIDTLDTLQALMKKERMREQRSSQFLRDDWGWLKEEMTAILESFLALPMHVFLIVHTKTKDIGSEKNPQTVVLPGLEGAIAEQIAGMVGYSLLSFRNEEVRPDGTKFTKYWLRAEGNDTYQYLGNRAAGRLPDVIEPDFKTLYDAAMANRPQQAQRQVQVDLSGLQTTGQIAAQPATEQVPLPQAPQQQPASPPPAVHQQPASQNPAQNPAQNPGQGPTGQPQGMPSDDEPVNAAALTHVKRVYDACGLPFPEDKIKALNLGQARNLVRMFKAVQMDHAEGKSPEGETAVQTMTSYLGSMGWLAEDGAAAEATKTVQPNLNGTIEEVKAYVGDSLERANEAFEVERAGRNRTSLLSWLESRGAGGQSAPVQTPVQTPGQAPAEGPQAPNAEVTPTPAADDEPSEEQAAQVVQERLGGVVVDQMINPSALCQECGNQIDDVDLAQLGKSRFGRVLCVSDYIAETKNK